MKKVILSIALAMMSVSAMFAQSEEFKYGLGNRIGIGVGAGTEGIGVDVSTCFNKYFGVRAGLNFMPDINIKTDVDIEPNVEGLPSLSGDDATLNVKGSLKRTSFDVKFDCYPTGGTFFVTAGFSVGGEKLVQITGHSDYIQNHYALANQYGIQIGDYNIPFDENGDVNGGLKVNNFRPYLGLGFGRLIPKNRIGFRFEMGVQFHGKPKVYADGVDADDLLNQLDEEASDDITKIMNDFKVWPVIKLSFRGRIL